LINSTTYPDLFSLLGSNVPDLRGYFLRGLESSATPSVETTINRALGSVQEDDNKAHTHTYTDCIGVYNAASALPTQ